MNRITTNDILENLNTRTLLLDDNGRIIDNFIIVNSQEKFKLLISDSSKASDLKNQITKYVILEDINVENISSSYARISIFGEGSIKLLSEIFNFSITQSKNIHYKDFSFFIFLDNSKPLEWIDIIIEKNDLQYIIGFLSSSFLSISDFEFKNFRFNNLITVLDEIVGIHPLELSMNQLISFDKGCYIGQEVVARMDTYNKIQRKLVRITSDYPFEEKILRTIESNNVGLVLSYLCKSFDSSKFSGIGLIKNKEINHSILCGDKIVSIIH
ncbi:MAG: hypothetical protein CL748_00920 [Chloroflexi bacterium]|nr:hypothetical protein [Chloroflexota bacterium]